MECLAQRSQDLKAWKCWKGSGQQYRKGLEGLGQSCRDCLEGSGSMSLLPRVRLCSLLVFGGRDASEEVEEAAEAVET